jgi:hypothetical protein
MITAPPAEAPPGERSARAQDNCAYVRFLMALRHPELARKLEIPRCPRCGR